MEILCFRGHAPDHQRPLLVHTEAVPEASRLIDSRIAQRDWVARVQ